MFKKNSYLVLLLSLFIGTQAFFGCDISEGNNSSKQIPMPEALKGSYLSTYSEEFIITGTEFTSAYGGAVGYKGNIVNVRDDGGDTAGYITIRYTENTWNTPAIGNFYVIHYKNLTNNSVDLAGSSDGDGKITQDEAEDEYTVTNGYFSSYSVCAKQ
ncbi:MAG: hypothetical protein LBT84_02120 [Spirochaetia bacterium]|nr:hypothetical protein [Spirochaetia bacterium]